MSGDLLALASRYVSLTGEIEGVRRAMLACLANGSAPPEAKPEPKPNPTRRPKGPLSNHPIAIKAAEVDREIIAMLKATPGMKVGEIAKATTPGARPPPSA